MRYKSCKLFLGLAATTLLLGSLATAAGAEDAMEPKRVEVGQEAPAFSLQGSDGETHALSALRGEKNLVLVFFRGTW